MAPTLQLSRNKGIMPSPINISTALTRLLKLTRGEQQAAILRNPNFATLILEANVLIRDPIACKEVNTQTLANLAYAVARLHRPGTGAALKGVAADLAGLLDGIEAVILLNRSEDKFKPKELANVMWAFAKCNHGSRGLYAVAARRALDGARQLEDYQARDFASLVWAFGKAKAHEPELFAAIEAEIASRRGRDLVNGQDIANIVTGFAAVQHPAPLLFRMLQAQMLKGGGEVFGSFEAVTIVVVAEAFVSAHQGSERLFCALLQRASDIGFAEFTAGHMAQLAQAAVRAVGHTDDATLALKAMCTEIEHRPVPKALSPDHIMLLAALNSLGMPPPKTLVGLSPSKVDELKSKPTTPSQPEDGVGEEDSEGGADGGEDQRVVGEDDEGRSERHRPQWKRIHLDVSTIGAAGASGIAHAERKTSPAASRNAPASAPAARSRDEGNEPRVNATEVEAAAAADGDAEGGSEDQAEAEAAPSKYRDGSSANPKRRPRAERRRYQAKQLAAGNPPWKGYKAALPPSSRSVRQRSKLEQQLRKLEGLVTHRDGVRPSIVMEKLNEPFGGHTTRIMLNGKEVSRAHNKKRDVARLNAVNSALQSSFDTK